MHGSLQKKVTKMLYILLIIDNLFLREFKGNKNE